MQYKSYYQSPLGEILLAADEFGLNGLWFEGQKYFASRLRSDSQEQELPIFEQTKDWLDLYFSGKEPDFTPTLHPEGSDFQLKVWELLWKVPYGSIITYGEIAAQATTGYPGAGRGSARAVGGAVGHNPISILIPCHRVIGVNGSLTGYAGGIERKKALLKLERGDIEPLLISKKSSSSD